MPGICELDLPGKYNNEAIEAWGKGKRFGFVKISAKKVYWFAVINSKSYNSRKTNVAELFKEFHKDILTIISATSRDHIIESNIMDLKPINKWQNDKACLVGDAAHATTPNMGQGACQSIEDAYVLGNLLKKSLSIRDAFREYEMIRREKAHKIVKMSWTLGKVAQLENELLMKSRNWVLGHLPKYINKKQIDMVFELDGKNI